MTPRSGRTVRDRGAALTGALSTPRLARVVSLALAGLPILCALPGGACAAGKPNAVFVLSDDEEVALVERMPNVKALVARQGATFTHAYYNDPLCTPSR